jgi:hypothetical protein
MRGSCVGSQVHKQSLRATIMAKPEKVRASRGSETSPTCRLRPATAMVRFFEDPSRAAALGAAAGRASSSPFDRKTAAGRAARSTLFATARAG